MSGIGDALAPFRAGPVGPAEWSHLARALLAPTAPHLDAPAAGLLDLPGAASVHGRRMDRFESFARTFLLAAFASRRDPDAVAPYRSGLVAGARGTWPAIRDDGQAMVEACGVALGLWVSRAVLWDRMAEHERRAIADYLRPMATARCSVGNWHLFRLVVVTFLQDTGYGDFEHEIDEVFAILDTLHRGDGWYSDGRGPDDRVFDYYTAWAFHFYPLLWLHLAADVPAGRAAIIRARAAAYHRALIRMIGADGTPVLQGRSLLYRCAIVASLAAGELVGAVNPPVAVVRRALRLVLGATLPDAAFEHGIPTLGWRGAFPPIVQDYSGPGSPYWLVKAFAVLLLPDEHPLWSAPEAPLPVEEGDFATVLPAPGWVLTGSADDGIVRVTNVATCRPRRVRNAARPELADDALYGRLAYSTATTPFLADPTAVAVRPGLPPDNWIGTLSADGTPAPWEHLRPERSSPTVSVATVGVSRPARDRFVPGVDLHVAVLRRGPFEVRAARVIAGRDEAVGATGYLLSGDRLEAEHGDGGCLARRDDGLRSILLDLTGGATAEPTDRGPAALGGSSLLPQLTWPATPGTAVRRIAVLVALVGATSAPLEPPVVRWDGDDVQVEWPDGTRQHARLLPTPHPSSTEGAAL